MLLHKLIEEIEIITNDIATHMNRGQFIEAERLFVKLGDLINDLPYLKAGGAHQNSTLKKKLERHTDN